MQLWRLLDTRLLLLRGDITEQAVDAIVNAANSSLLGGGGVDGAIHRRGGPEILDACRAIRRSQYPAGLPAGDAVITTAGSLPARHVIHTVGPIWRAGDARVPQLLEAAYASSLARAIEHELRTIAFPSISTGAYGYPIAAAAEIALSTVRKIIEAHPASLDEVRFILFSETDLNVYASAAAKLLGPGASY